MAVEEHLTRLRQETDRLKDFLVHGTLMLVDLVASTPYKTANPEEIWLPRLVAFRKAVERAIDPLKPTKYFGDGILVFAPQGKASPAEFLEMAHRVHENLREINRSYPNEHAIRARVVLGFGPVFLLDETDPQSSTVDKLFRLDKHVPGGSVGMDAEFREQAKVENVLLVDRLRLKGLTEDSHELYLLEPLDGGSLLDVNQLTR